jgi:hypothetical protein
MTRWTCCGAPAASGASRCPMATSSPWRRSGPSGCGKRKRRSARCCPPRTRPRRRSPVSGCPSKRPRSSPRWRWRWCRKTRCRRRRPPKRRRATVRQALVSRPMIWLPWSAVWRASTCPASFGSARSAASVPTTQAPRSRGGNGAFPSPPCSRLWPRRARPNPPLLRHGCCGGCAGRSTVVSSRRWRVRTAPRGWVPRRSASPRQASARPSSRASPKCSARSDAQPWRSARGPTTSWPTPRASPRRATPACRAQGFRTALVGAESTVLPLLAPQRLGLDLVQLRWSPGLPAALAATEMPLAPESVALSGADTAAAIGWGWEQGITRFEGRLLRPRGG